MKGLTQDEIFAFLKEQMDISLILQKLENPFAQISLFNLKMGELFQRIYQRGYQEGINERQENIRTSKLN